MKLSEYLEGLRAAKNASELESAIQAPFKHSFYGRTWKTISKVRIESGNRICAHHPYGHFVPRLDGRTLAVCGQKYRIGKGYNGSGYRYVWHAAGEFVKTTLRSNGLSQRAAYRIWGEWADYPHRCLAIVEAGLKGQIKDPELNRLRFSYMSVGPIRITVAQNDADPMDRRAMRPCRCGGTLFDWGSGFNDDFTFVNWHCNVCPRVFIEYVSERRFREIRQPHHKAVTASAEGELIIAS